MYEFIRIQFIMGRLTADQVRGSVPQYITSEQAETIINGGSTADK